MWDFYRSTQGNYTSTTAMRTRSALPWQGSSTVPWDTVLTCQNCSSATTRPTESLSIATRITWSSMAFLNVINHGKVWYCFLYFASNYLNSDSDVVWHKWITTNSIKYCILNNILSTQKLKSWNYQLKPLFHINTAITLQRNLLSLIL